MSFPEFEPNELHKAKASRRRRSDAGRPSVIYRRPNGSFVVTPFEFRPDARAGWTLVPDVRR